MEIWSQNAEMKDSYSFNPVFPFIVWIKREETNSNYLIYLNLFKFVNEYKFEVVNRESYIKTITETFKLDNGNQSKKLKQNNQNVFVWRDGYCNLSLKRFKSLNSLEDFNKMLILGWEYIYSTLELGAKFENIVLKQNSNQLEQANVLKEELKPILSAQNNPFIIKLKSSLGMLGNFWGFWSTLNYESLLDFLIRLKEAQPLMVELQEYENFIKTKVLVLENNNKTLLYHTDETYKKASFIKTPKSELIIREWLDKSEKIKIVLNKLSKCFEEMILQYRVVHWDFDWLTPNEIERVKQFQMDNLEALQNSYGNGQVLNLPFV